MMINKGGNPDYRLHYNHVLIDTSHFFDFIPYTQVQSFAILIICIYIIYFCILFCRDQIELQYVQEVFQSPKDFKTSHASA